MYHNQELFNYMLDEHNVILLESEMDEIISICKRINNSMSEGERQPVGNNERGERCEHTYGYIKVQIIDNEYWCVDCKKPI